MWRIFRWAYKITKEMVFINCVPVGCSCDLDVPNQPVEFTVMPPPKFITELADSEVRRAYNTWMKGLTEE
ncbi:MAG: hypothetical protein NC311_06750 [Muribaculaceae bacterium]|nr:hypothetical protein [Muribaculaceae bacterium]